MLNGLRNWWENWDENYKKTVLTVLFTVTVTLLAYATYYVFFRPQPTLESPTLPSQIEIGTLPPTDIKDILEKRGIPVEPTPPTPTLPSSELKPDAVARGGRTIARPLVYTNAENVDLTKDGSIKFYDKGDGKFYSIDSEGNRLPLSPQSFPNIQDATWAPQGRSAILEFPDGSNIYYDFETQKQYSLPKEGIDFNFSSSGNQIGYKFITNNPDNNWLIVSNPTGENTSAVEHIGDANPVDVQTNWSPDDTKVALYRSSSGVDTEEVLFIGKNQENFRSLPVEGRGFSGLWSPVGTRLLYNVYNPQTGYRPELWVTDAKSDTLGINKKSLGLRTWVNKCVFTSDEITVYCAVPLYLQQGSGIYPTVANSTPDTIYKINVKTGFKQQIAIPTNALGVGFYSAQKLMLSPDEKTLNMVDVNGGIYEIKLE